MAIGSAGKWEREYRERQRLIKKAEAAAAGKKVFSFRSFLLPLIIVSVALPLAALGYYGYQKYSSEAAVEVSGNTILVKQGGDLQAALNRAKRGDMILLQAGATFKGNFFLPNKPGNEFITIRSSALDSQLPPANTRLDPAKYATQLPKILTPNSQPAIYAEKGTHHYRLIGLEISSGTADYVYNLVSLGGDEQRNMQEVPRFLEIDRCYIRPGSKGKTRRGVALNSGDTEIKNSYISGFAYAQEETQAIAGWNGPGPFKIINNYLEAGAENILFGGSDPGIKGLIPSDIEIRNNYMTKPLEWRGKVTIKCTFELKNAKRVVVSGNIIENSFDNEAVRLTVRNQDGKSPWSTIEDVLMQNNIIRNSGGGFRILGKDDTYPSETMKRVKIVNNLFADISGKKYGGDGRWLVIGHGTDITFANNTVFHDGNVINAYGEPVKGFVFRDNIFSYNDYGYNGDKGGVGKPVLAIYFPDGQILGNVIVNGKNGDPKYIYAPPRNTLAPSFQSVGFVDLQKGNYRLATNSRFKRKASNGGDPGCNIDLLEREIGNNK